MRNLNTFLGNIISLKLFSVCNFILLLLFYSTKSFLINAGIRVIYIFDILIFYLPLLISFYAIFRFIIKKDYLLDSLLIVLFNITIIVIAISYLDNLFYK
jgi:hypothetical protein